MRNEIEKIQIPYFQLYASDFLMYKNLLTNDELIEVIEAISLYCLFDKKTEFNNEYQQAFYDKLTNSAEKNKQNYLIKIQNGRKGGRPPKNLNETETKPIGYEQVNLNETETKPKRNQYNIIEDNRIEYNKKENNIKEKINNVESVPENLEPIKPIDPYTSDLIEKVFNIYTKECNNLCPLGGYARKNRSLREAISGYMWQTNNDIEYFTTICKKANELKIIADKKIDLKMILNCYEGIDNGKYIKTEAEEWSVNDLFKKEEK